MHCFTLIKKNKKYHHIYLFVILPLGIKVFYQQARFSLYWHGHLSQDGLLPKKNSQGTGLFTDKLKEKLVAMKS